MQLQFAAQPPLNFSLVLDQHFNGACPHSPQADDG
jgi:hypothetical protein